MLAAFCKAKIGQGGSQSSRLARCRVVVLSLDSWVLITLVEPEVANIVGQRPDQETSAQLIISSLCARLYIEEGFNNLGEK